MRRRGRVVVPLLLAAWSGWCSAAWSQTTPAGAPKAPASGEKPADVATPPATMPAAPARPDTDAAGADKARALLAAMRARRLGSTEAIGLDVVRRRVAEAEELRGAGRHDEAAARLVELVESPAFEPFAENEEGRAALFLTGDTYAALGAYAPARAYLRRLLAQKTATLSLGSYAARAVRRLVDIALETERPDVGLTDVKSLPSPVPDEVAGEVAYLAGRAKQPTDPDGAIAAYLTVPKRSRFWSQAHYLAGVLHADRGRLKESEQLFCRVADPGKKGDQAPVFGDTRFFQTRDLARLGLGRVAHEGRRHDDARYYYYLVPRDSNRLAEALYESATTRYEAKDYQGARELLDELHGTGVHHVYEDEAAVLDAFVDIAQCKFPDADKRLVEFIRRYEPVRDEARRVGGDERAVRELLGATRGAASPRGLGARQGDGTDTLAAIAALVRVDPTYGQIVKKRALLDREASGLKLATRQLTDLGRTLSQGAGVAPQPDAVPDRRAEDARESLAALRREIDALASHKAAAAQTTMLRQEADGLEERLRQRPGGTDAAAATEARGTDLPALLTADAESARALVGSVDAARESLERAEASYARDALRRLDLRLSRLLRRARLGRIEAVLGRKRALEIEIDAIANGYLPKDAVDSMDAARYLRDDEEYWPFEGDDWPDEFVGSEGLR